MASHDLPHRCPDSRSNPTAAGPNRDPEMAGAPLRHRADGAPRRVDPRNLWAGGAAVHAGLARPPCTAPTGIAVRHPLRDALESLRQPLFGDSAGSGPGARRGEAPGDPRPDSRGAGIHHQPSAGRFCHAGQPARPRAQRRATGARARRARSGWSCRTSTSGRAPSGCGASSFWRRTIRDSGSRTATTCGATRGPSSATGDQTRCGCGAARAAEVAFRQGSRQSPTHGGHSTETHATGRRG